MTKLIYGTPEYEAVKAEILSIWGATPIEEFDVKNAIRARIDYLKGFIKNSGLKGFALGISGGVDSSTAGKLCQLACEELREEGCDAKFVAMRLPAGVQFDEEDAQIALKFIKPDVVLNVNIGATANVFNAECLNAVTSNDINLTASQADFHKGNIKARLRMAAQYYAAAVYGLGVVGTDFSCEAIMGYFSKFADGACDLTVLGRTTKSQNRLMAKELGAPESVYKKPATADLEELNEGHLDESSFGFPYDYLDTFTEGKAVPKEIEHNIVCRYDATRHKRDAIPGYFGLTPKKI